MELILSLMLIASAFICYTLCKILWRETMDSSDCEKEDQSSYALSNKPLQTKYIYTATKNKNTSF